MATVFWCANKRLRVLVHSLSRVIMIAILMTRITMAMIDRSRPARVLSVLGMHRSGTSCLTGSLQQGGLFLGKFHEWNEYNRKGNRENQDVVDLHEQVFKANGLNWKQPLRPARGWRTLWRHPPAVWSPEHYAQARTILASYADHALWGFKDPRTLMLLPGWHKLVPDMEFVGIYRHPWAVVKSLCSRPALPVTEEEALRMWYQYNSALLQQYRRKPFPLLCFDWSEEQLHQRLEQLHRELGLLPLAADERFYTKELHKQSAELQRPLPTPVNRLYQQLEKLSRL